jgi:galactose mutarotase-like enzyme
MHLTEASLENPRTSVLIVPGEGGRVQSLFDRRSGRELLLQREGALGARVDFLASCRGGWDELFPNDSPWDGHPDHGVVWTAPFHVLEARRTTLLMSCELDSPPVDIERRVSLLGEERCGVAVEMCLSARAATGPFLWAAHPMLAVREGWRVDLPAEAANAEVDSELPGRLAPGPLDAESVAQAAVVPPREAAVCEVVYVDGVDHADVRSPDGHSRTRVHWDGRFLRHLWIVVITGSFGLDDCLLIEPSTSRPYRLEEAIGAGSAFALERGEQVRWWVTVESLDS